MSRSNKEENKKDSTSSKTNQLHRMDEKQLKDLLDEAYSYKKYSDRDSKSKIFKELLDKAELEDKERISAYNEIFTRKSQKKYNSGGSLQNLNDAVGFEYTRNKKSTVSVTTREYGGGSLPCNFNNMLYSEKYDDLRTKDTNRSSKSPIMDVENLIVYSPCDSSRKEDLNASLNCIVNQVKSKKSDDGFINRKSSFYVSSADAVIDIPLLEMKNDIDDQKPLQLCSAYSSVKCIIDDKGVTQPVPIVVSHVPKAATSNLIASYTTPLSQQPKNTDENGNNLSSTNINKTKLKMKVSKSDRNIKRTFRSTDIEGYRGGEEVETLVNYIENENQDKNKSKKNKSNTTDDKTKKKISKKNKVKRSNSLEELRSTKEFVDVQGHMNAEMSYSTKNLDRYSWGKAEISFLQSSTTNPDSDISKPSNGKRPTFSMESLLNDCSGFFLVTNKKKAKKKTQLILDEKEVKIQGNENFKCTNYNKAKHKLHNEKQVNNKKVNKLLKARRKSFSSVPQSDISDCSDVESVHSLPDSYRKLPSNGESYLSYAEIIRKNPISQKLEVKKYTSIETESKRTTDKKREEEKISASKTESEKNSYLKELVKSSSLGHDLHEAHKISKGLQELHTFQNDKNKYKANEDFKRNGKSKEYNFFNQPAVIMKDCNVSAVNELVFGFDINKDLLYDDQQLCVNVSKHDNDETDSSMTTKGIIRPQKCKKPDSSSEFSQPESLKHAGELQKIINIPTNRNNRDLENLVNFVSSAWNEIVNYGKFEYYNDAAFHVST